MQKKEKSYLGEVEKQYVLGQRQLKDLIEKMLSMQGAFEERTKDKVLINDIGSELELGKYYMVRFRNKIRQSKKIVFKLMRKSKDGCEVLKEYPDVKGFSKLKKKINLENWPLQIEIREVPENYAVTLAL